MSTAIIHKKTAVSGRSPSTSQLEYGELAINTVDGKIFFKYDPGTGDTLATVLEVTEDNLAVDSSGLTNSNSNFLSGVLADIDGAITAAVSGGLTSVSTDGTLTGNGTSGSPLSVDINLDDVGDVDLSTAPTSGQVLKWNGTAWVAADDIDTTLTLSSASVGDLGDVDITTTAPTSGQVLKWDGSAFVPADDIDTTLTLSSASIDALGDVDTSTAGPSIGNVLKWDGTNWVPGVSTGGGGVSYAEQTATSEVFTGNGSTTNFSFTIVPDSEDHVIVSLNGIVQDPQTYSVSGTTLTFSTAPANGDNIECRIFSGYTTSVALNNYASYTYTIGTNTTSVTGADDDGVTLQYSAGRVEVYVNGVRFVDGSDYTATNGTSVTFTETVLAGSVVEVVSLASAHVLNAGVFGAIESESILLSTTAQAAVASFDRTVYRTAKFLVQMTHATGGYHTTEVLMIHDGSTVYMTEYATIFTSASLGSIDAQVNGSNGMVELLVTPAATNTTVKTKRISVEV